MPFAESAKGRVRKAFRLALNELGRRGRDYIRQTISVPDVYEFNDKGQLTNVVRSDPGEPPRMETSDVAGNEPRLLWKSIEYRVDAGAVTLSALHLGPNAAGRAKDCPYAWALEYGTDYMEPRPYMKPAMQFIRANRKDVFDTVFSEKLADLNAAAESSEIFTADFPAED